MDYLWVGVGGFAGANARYLLGSWIAARLGPTFPWSTLVINVTGSFLIGLLLTFLALRVDLPSAWRLLLVVGFLGGYTTFSSYSAEAIGLFAQGRWIHGAAYVLGSNGLALSATLAGIGLATRSLSQ
jgi:CrcB protein